MAVDFRKLPLARSDSLWNELFPKGGVVCRSVAEQVRVYGLLDAGPLTGISAGVSNRVIVEGSAGPHGRGEQPRGGAIPLAIDGESLLQRF
jgi:hypothetical protein